MNDTELFHYRDCTDSDRLDFISYRNELAMLSVTTILLQSRVLALKNDVINRDTPTWWQRYALIYRDGQERLYKHTLDVIKQKKLDVLNRMKLELDNNRIAPVAPFLDILNPGFFGQHLDNIKVSTFVPLESVTMTLKKLLGSDQEFKNVINQLFEDIQEELDVVLMLALIRESTKKNSIWKSFIHATKNDSAQQRDKETLIGLQELYDSLFPAFSDAFPTVFDPSIYTFENLLWAENIISNYTLDNPLVIVTV
ncbi:uncharacterized protein BX664DRAFT_255930 [Halteromyces radiatus]|uniref:uncharacterized protein n=1 Tax=Halteromyces radiatus TaxID=101107 RepID=UPI00221FC986|nr:uncharacterized protein BX664DRAFT_255930 [Halteromyces radiatus]KAI8100068.1 hypothetical protein BX664DRAFT_255930 [Halteromyces radiatus]